MTLRVRPARHADLATVADIWIDSAFGEKPPVGVAAAYLDHELATGVGAIAEDDSRPIGFGILLTRGPVSNLGELFVRRGTQSKGVGAAILGHLLRDRPSPLFTVASHDPRALALYVRHGMVPRWPYWYLRAEAGRLALAGTDVAAVETTWDDGDWAAWDLRLAGRPRASEHGYLRATCAGQPLWLRRGGATVGYGCVQLAGHTSGGDIAVIGPLGAADAADATAVALAAVAWAAARRPVVHIDVPGPHAAIPALVGAGFRVVDQDTFMSTNPPDFFDPRRYAPIGAEFF